MVRQRGAVGAGVLLGLLVLVVVGCAEKAGPEKHAEPTVRDDESAVKAIGKLGGKVTRDDKQHGNPVVRVDLGNTQVTDADLKDLKELQSLQELSLGGTKVTDTGLKQLKDLKSLHVLYLTRTKVTGTGLKELKSLQTLLLYDSKVTDVGLKELKE